MLPLLLLVYSFQLMDEEGNSIRNGGAELGTQVKADIIPWMLPSQVFGS
jgi:hypothetical protein